MSLRFDATPLPDVGSIPPVRDRGVAIDPALRAACHAHGPAEANCDRLFAPNALCVTTGQQPGLFTGPLFTVYKALSAVVYARRLERTWDRPVVPVFWAAGDDHDLVEANHVEIPVAGGGEPHRVALPGRAEDAASLPLYREALGPEITAQIEAVRALVPDTEFRTEVLDWLERHYRPEADYARAFIGALGELLGPYGVVVFDPTHAAAKRAAAPWLIRALEHATDLDQRLRDRAIALETAGRPVPVPTRAGETLVMIEGRSGRDRLVVEDGGFTTRRSGEGWSLDDLRAVATAEPERLSANVLLRPVVEAALFPTVAYVAGPGELAYFPQTDPVFATLGVTPTPAVPRWSARLVEHRVHKVLDRHALSLDDLALPEGQLESRLMRDALPDAARTALEAMREAVEREYPAVITAAVEIDPTLEKPVTASRVQIQGQLDHAEKRIVARLKQQHETLVRQLAGARAMVWPHRRPQERVYTVLPYLIRYGWSFLEAALDAAEADLAPLETAT